MARFNISLLQSHCLWRFSFILVFALGGCQVSSRPVSTPASSLAVPASPAATPLTRTITPTLPPTPHPQVPYELVSLDSLLASLEDLTSIQAYSGWRNAGNQGEAEALQYVQDQLKGFTEPS